MPKTRTCYEQHPGACHCEERMTPAPCQGCGSTLKTTRAHRYTMPMPSEPEPVCLACAMVQRLELAARLLEEVTVLCAHDRAGCAAGTASPHHWEPGPVFGVENERDLYEVRGRLTMLMQDLDLLPRCAACGREELECSANPCEDTLADRLS